MSSARMTGGLIRMFGEFISEVLVEAQQKKPPVPPLKDLLQGAHACTCPTCRAAAAAD